MDKWWSGKMEENINLPIILSIQNESQVRLKSYY